MDNPYLHHLRNSARKVKIMKLFRIKCKCNRCGKRNLDPWFVTVRPERRICKHCLVTQP